MSIDKDNFQFRTDDDDEENAYKIDQGVVDASTAMDIPSLGNHNDYLLALPSGVVGLLMGPETRNYHQPKIKCGQVKSSLKQILPHWDKRVPGNDTVSQLCAAIDVIIEYRSVAMWRCPHVINIDERFCYGTDTARPNVHAKEFKNKVIAKLINDAWFGANRTRYVSLRQHKSFQCFRHFMLPLAEWMVLHMNPYGELKQKDIIATHPGTFRSSMTSKVNTWGVWEIDVIMKYDQQRHHQDNDSYNTKDACKGMPLEFAMLMDRLYNNFFEDCKFKHRQQVWVSDDSKKHSLWLANRKDQSRFPRIVFTIPGSANVTVPQPATRTTGTQQHGGPSPSKSSGDSDSDSESSTSPELKAAESQITRLKRQLRNAKGLLESSKEHLSSTNAAFTIAKRKLEELEDEREHNTSKIRRLEKELTEAFKNQTQTSLDKDQAVAEKDEAEDLYEATIQKAEENRKRYLDTLKQLEDEKKAALQEVQLLKSQLSTLTQQNESLRHPPSRGNKQNVTLSSGEEGTQPEESINDQEEEKEPSSRDEGQDSEASDSEASDSDGDWEPSVR
jgi:hypothetical protein